MCRKQLCPKCGSDAMLYYDRNAIWICGKCKRLFSSYMDEIACDDALFHKLLLYLACEQDTLRDELINALPDPRVLISIESEKDGEEEEKSQRKGLSPERRIVYQEVYHMLQALQPSNRHKIPENILDFIDRARDRDFVPAFDISKGKEETRKISRDALALFGHLNMEYMCGSEEKEQLQRTYEENEVKHQKARMDFLCRRIREADEFDWAGQSERLDQFPKLYAEVCCAMEYLPADITDKLFTDEDLIQLLIYRDYSHYSGMKDKLLVYNRMTENFEYKGSTETLQFLKNLAETNDCHELQGDIEQP